MKSFEISQSGFGWIKNNGGKNICINRIYLWSRITCSATFLIVFGKIWPDNWLNENANFFLVREKIVFGFVGPLSVVCLSILRHGFGGRCIGQWAAAYNAQNLWPHQNELSRNENTGLLGITIKRYTFLSWKHSHTWSTYGVGILHVRSIT